MSDLHYLIGGLFTPDQFCALVGISARTFERWAADPDRIPTAVRLWLDLRRGNLGQFHGFAGWAINERHGEIVTPEGIGVSLSQIEHVRMLLGERPAYEGEIRRLREELARRPPAPSNVITFPGHRSACARDPRPAADISFPPGSPQRPRSR